MQKQGIRAAASIFRSIDATFSAKFESMVKGESSDDVNPEQCENTGRKLQLPIQAKRLDHYTLICRDAREVTDFHINTLGFEIDSIKPINSGTMPEGEVDMLKSFMN